LRTRLNTQGCIMIKNTPGGKSFAPLSSVSRFASLQERLQKTAMARLVFGDRYQFCEVTPNHPFQAKVGFLGGPNPRTPYNKINKPISNPHHSNFKDSKNLVSRLAWMIFPAGIFPGGLAANPAAPAPPLKKQTDQSPILNLPLSNFFGSFQTTKLTRLGKARYFPLFNFGNER